MNLNFESATVPISDQVSRVPSTSAFPGWNVLLGSTEQASVLYNGITLGSASVGLLHSNTDFRVGAIEGRFSAVLQAGDSSNGVVAASITQLGTVPADSQSIQAKMPVGTTDFLVTFNGSAIPMSPLTSTAQYAVYGGDISGFAGVSGTLAITAAPLPQNPYNGFVIDSLVFSSEPVPEPGAAALAALALLLAAGCSTFKRRRA